MQRPKCWMMTHWFGKSLLSTGTCCTYNHSACAIGMQTKERTSGVRYGWANAGYTRNLQLRPSFALIMHVACVLCETDVFEPLPWDCDFGWELLRRTVKPPREGSGANLEAGTESTASPVTIPLQLRW